MHIKRQRRPAWRDVGWLPDVEHVLPVATLLITAQLAFRAWALSQNWFYYDDFYLIRDGGSATALSHLFAPHNGHLMPGARLMAWAVAQNGGLNWMFAGALTLLIQAAASGGALWMLFTMFGRRWGIVGPLALYLTSAFTMPSLIWWAVAINELPTQAAFFIAIGCWVNYLRTTSWRWLGLTVLAVAGGLAFDVREILVVPILAFLLVAYFSSGALGGRLRSLVRYWPGIVVGGVIALAYAAAYRHLVPQPFNESSWKIFGQTADYMVATAFPVGLVGGPWAWDGDLLVAAPPDWSVHAAWVAVLAVPVYAWLRRERTLRAWIPAVYLLVAILVLVSQTRAPALGPLLGLDYRFYAEVASAVVLGLGLSSMQLVGAVESSRARPAPYLVRTPPRWVTAALAVVVLVSGITSSASYVLAFRAHNQSRAYLDTAVGDLERVGNTDLINQELPVDVMGLIFYPDNTTSDLLPMMTAHARFPQSAPMLSMIDESGDLRSVQVGDGVESVEGPDAECGWRITSVGRSVPLSGDAFEFSWWLRIGYLSSSDSPVRISAGDTTVDTMVLRGLNDLFVHVDGTFDSIRFSGLVSDTTVCVGGIKVGQPEPGDPR